VKKKKRRKLRVPFRKNRERRARGKKLPSEILDEDAAQDEIFSGERMSGKGELSRYRTVIVEDEDDDEGGPRLEIDEENCLAGRVVAATGLKSLVQTDDGGRYECTVRELVRKLSRDARNAVVTGDRVLFQLVNEQSGVIERVEPRSSTISRGSQYHQHIIVANVDRVVIVVSAEEPPLKPSLIDRFLISAEKGGVEPIICVNKIDLVEPAGLEPIVGCYARLGYETVLTSAFESPLGEPASERNGHRDGPGLRRLRDLLPGHQTVFAGQSGVGKSSLLNMLQPDWQLRTGEISTFSQKGKHTTRRAVLLPLDSGGWVVDTPGIRQFRLWDVLPEEVEAYFVEFRPFVALCKFPDCSHTHETGCGVKSAVAAELIAPMRYESYLKIVAGEDD